MARRIKAIPLARRVPARAAAFEDKDTLIDEAAAWNSERHAKVNWRFTTATARGKLKRLYPRFE